MSYNNTTPVAPINAQPLAGGAVPLANTYGQPVTVVTPTGATFAGGQTANPSALKGNITSMVGKMQHDPVKQHAGNAMVASSREAKAARFEAKALEWERKGNLAKAQKNRGKVLSHSTRCLLHIHLTCAYISLLFILMQQYTHIFSTGCHFPPEGYCQVEPARRCCSPRS